MFNLMDTIGLHVVAVIKKYRTEFWVAATRRNKAVEPVERALPAGWRVAGLDERRLSPQEIAKLNCAPMAFAGQRMIDGRSSP
jgi:hypothetical protein